MNVKWGGISSKGRMSSGEECQVGKNLMVGGISSGTKYQEGKNFRGGGRIDIKWKRREEDGEAMFLLYFPSYRDKVFSRRRDFSNK